MSNNTIMRTAAIPTEADVEMLFKSIAAGQPVDPDLAKRIRTRSEQLREELRKEHGILDVAADLIREIRDEE